jgi:hypothetical protein
VSERKFHQELKRRLAKDPGAAFDRRFWARFEQSFGTNPLGQPVSTRSKARLSGWRRWAAFGVPVAAALGLALWFFGADSMPRAERQLLDKDLDTLVVMDDLNQAIGGDPEEAEWNDVLLAENPDMDDDEAAE